MVKDQIFLSHLLIQRTYQQRPPAYSDHFLFFPMVTIVDRFDRTHLARSFLCWLQFISWYSKLKQASPEFQCCFETWLQQIAAWASTVVLNCFNLNHNNFVTLNYSFNFAIICKMSWNIKFHTDTYWPWPGVKSNLISFNSLFSFLKCKTKIHCKMSHISWYISLSQHYASIGLVYFKHSIKKHQLGGLTTETEIGLKHKQTRNKLV